MLPREAQTRQFRSLEPVSAPGHRRRKSHAEFVFFNGECPAPSFVDATAYHSVGSEAWLECEAPHVSNDSKLFRGQNQVKHFAEAGDDMRW